MNGVHAKNNRYKNGEYNKHYAYRYEMSQSRKEPTMSQIEYRDALYKFCIDKGLVRDSFRLGRTNREFSANIRALITILSKHGFADEFFGKIMRNKKI